MERQFVSNSLLEWWANNKRTFPWRISPNAYTILVAEKLLQQTAASDRVVNTFTDIKTHYPTIHDLALASVSDVSTFFEKLGLSYRAQELINICKFIISEYNGEIPANREGLLLIPGIGEYTARAILSFSYNLDFAIVDTNISRFLYRLFGLPGKQPKNPARNRELIELAQSLLPSGKSRDFNYAVLDFCAKVCTNKQPNCVTCPIRHQCILGTSIIASGVSVES